MSDVNTLYPLEQTPPKSSHFSVASLFTNINMVVYLVKKLFIKLQNRILSGKITKMNACYN